jgi:hypothetical protein
MSSDPSARGTERASAEGSPSKDGTFAGLSQARPLAAGGGSSGGTVERWNGGTVERWNGGMVERWNEVALSNSCSAVAESAARLTRSFRRFRVIPRLSSSAC